MNQWMRQALPGFGESVALEMLGFLGPDAREGLAAVRERREPRLPVGPPPSSAADGRTGGRYSTVTRVPIGV